MTRHSPIALIFALLSTMAANAVSLPILNGSEEFPSTFDAGYDFEGIVKLSNCSGSLFQLENAKDSDYGLILTNGHCLETGFPHANTFVTHQPSSRAFRLLSPRGDAAGIVKASEIVYATMTKTDMTIYKLRETYAEIKSKFGIRPLKLDNQHPALNEAIAVISGYWTRGYSCNIETFVPKLLEGEWTSEDSMRYSRPGCETIGGTSGSPVIRAGTRTVIGVNNTGNDNGEKCTEDNPCEVDARGEIFFEKGYSYGQQTFWIYSCLTPTNEFDLSVPGCLLFHS